MRLATMSDGSRDGRLVLVSPDGRAALPVPDIAQTLQAAIDDWQQVGPQLARRYASFRDGSASDAVAFVPADALAPLPRAWQWLDGSAFTTHGELMQRAYNAPALPTNPPLMYQGMSHQFLPGLADVVLPSEADGIDFEAEFGVIIDEVPMGTSASAALGHIKLVILLNDWSLRTIAATEMRTGFGWVQGKPACSVAPVAVSPDELGGAWREGRVHLPILVDFRGSRFGSANGGEMSVGFHDLIAHAARTRSLCAGTIIGSGTISNADYATVGSCCIAERRAIEMIDCGKSTSEYMRHGETVAMKAPFGADDLFGMIRQRTVSVNQG